MASRICAQCGQEAPRTARFCSNCASSLVGEPTIPRPQQTVEMRNLDVAAAKSKSILLYVLIAGVIVMMLVAVFAFEKYTSLLNARVAPPISAPPVIQAPAAPAPVAPPVTQAPTVATVAPPVTQAPVVTPTPTPPAVVAYLSFVQQMEQYRSQLDNAQAAALLPLIGTAQALKTDDDSDKSNGTSTISQAMTANLAKWQNLIRTFQAQTPPAGCEDLGNTYYKFLEDYTDLCSQIQVALENGDTAKVMSLQGAQSSVDADANAADAALAEVCTKFNAKKTFTISGEDSGSTSPVL